jgi:hypothetical protein
LKNPAFGLPLEQTIVTVPRLQPDLQKRLCGAAVKLRRQKRPGGRYFFLCLFFRSFFLRLWVAILRSLRFLPQGTSASPYQMYIQSPDLPQGRQESDSV